MAITIKVNGKTETLEDHISILALLEYFDIEPYKVIIERNNEVVSNDTIDQVILKEGDRIEIIRIVSGG